MDAEREPLEEQPADQSGTDVPEDQQAPDNAVDEASEGAGSAPENDDEGDAQEENRVEFSEEQQQKLNQIISAKTRRYHEERERAERLERQLAELSQGQGQEQRPEVPAFPDAYDSDFDAKVERYREQVRKQAEFDARQEREKARIEAQQQEQIQKRQQELQTKVQQYSDRATKLGIGGPDLQQYGSVVSQSLSNDEVAQFILEDEAGPLITKYLAENPLELENVSTMTAAQAAAYVTAKVKSNLVGRKKPKAPKPPDTLDGRGVPRKSRGPAGAKFE